MKAYQIRFEVKFKLSFVSISYAKSIYRSPVCILIWAFENYNLIHSWIEKITTLFLFIKTHSQTWVEFIVKFEVKFKLSFVSVPHAKSIYSFPHSFYFTDFNLNLLKIIIEATTELKWLLLYLIRIKTNSQTRVEFIVTMNESNTPVKAKSTLSLVHIHRNIFIPIRNGVMWFDRIWIFEKNVLIKKKNKKNYNF